MKIYFEGRYFHPDKGIDRNTLSEREFEYLNKKLNWNESYNIGDTEEERSQAKQVKGDIPKRKGQRVPTKGGADNKRKRNS